MWPMLGVLVFALDVWAMLDILRRPVDSASKIMWLVMVWLLPVMGLAIYLLLGRESLAARERPAAPSV